MIAQPGSSNKVDKQISASDHLIFKKIPVLFKTTLLDIKTYLSPFDIFNI